MKGFKNPNPRFLVLLLVVQGPGKAGTWCTILDFSRGGRVLPWRGQIFVLPWGQIKIGVFSNISSQFYFINFSIYQVELINLQIFQILTNDS